jgi:hypothetical protein
MATYAGSTRPSIPVPPTPPTVVVLAPQPGLLYVWPFQHTGEKILGLAWSHSDPFCSRNRRRACAAVKAAAAVPPGRLPPAGYHLLTMSCIGFPHHRGTVASSSMPIHKAP